MGGRETDCLFTFPFQKKTNWARSSVAVKALGYKPEGRGF
jgi:hypothetical protein